MAPEVGKPGINYLQVTPEHRKKINSIVKYYRKKAHPFRACLLPDTPIDCPRDHERHPDGIPLHDVREGDHVWSFNLGLEVYELKRVMWAGPTRRSAKLMRLTLDSGRQIIATPDHRFLRRDGTWAELRELAAGDSLMPLYRDFTPRVKLHPDEDAGWHDEHRVIVEQVFGDARTGLHAHHTDERYCNTHPDNFELLTSSEHRKRHKETIQKRFERMGHRRACCDCLAEFAPRNGKHIRCDPCRKLREYGGRLAKPIPCKTCGTEFLRTKGHQMYCPTCREARVRRPIHKGTMRLCLKCSAEFVVNSPPHKFCSAECRESYVPPTPAVALWNHKVVSIEALSYRRDVWDMEVEDNHTFVVHGVVVHNCVRDNRKRFGPRTEQVCAVVKDMAMGTTKWRKGGKKHLSAAGVPTTIDLSVALSGLIELAEVLIDAEKPKSVIDLAEWDGKL